MVTKVRSNMVTHKKGNDIVGLKDELDLLDQAIVDRPLPFDSVEDLKASELAVGTKVGRYYYEKGDAGYAEMLIKSAGQAALDGDVVDGHINVFLDNGNVAVIYTGGDPIHIRQAGAKHYYDDPDFDNVPPIQACINREGDMHATAGIYRVDSSLMMKNTQRFTGEGDLDNANNNRVQARLYPTGNFPVFVNDPTISGRQYVFKRLRISWSLVAPDTTPTSQATQGNRYGFKFEGTQWTAPYSVFEDIEINEAWGMFYDNTDNYFNKLTRVVGRYNKFGFYKQLGTMFHFDSCSNSDGDMAFELFNTISPTLINCACDNMDVTINTDGQTVSGGAKSAVYLYACNSFSIIGFDIEGGRATGNQTSLFRFRNVTGHMAGLTGLNNGVDATGADSAAFIRGEEGSHIELHAIDPKYNGGATNLFAGDLAGGDVATVYMTGASHLAATACDFTAPVGGVTANKYSVNATGGSFAYLTACETDEVTQGIIFNAFGGTLATGAINATGVITGSTGLSIGGDFTFKGETTHTEQVDDNGGGTAIFPSYFGDVPITGTYEAVEIGTDKYLTAHVYKEGTTVAPVVTTLSNNGLTINATNSAGVISVTGYTVAGNVRLKAVLKDTGV